MITFKQFMNEMAGTFAIVGCGENPNYQVWGARSDLGCHKKPKRKKSRKKSRRT